MEFAGVGSDRHCLFFLCVCVRAIFLCIPTLLFHMSFWEDTTSSCLSSIE